MSLLNFSALKFGYVTVGEEVGKFPDLFNTIFICVLKMNWGIRVDEWIKGEYFMTFDWGSLQD